MGNQYQYDDKTRFITNFPSVQTVAGTVNVNTHSVVQVRNTAYTGSYAFNLADVTGVAAANTFLSLLNPVGSGKIVTLFSTQLISYSLADTGTNKFSVRVFRITAASAGTLQASSAICKFNSADTNPVAEVRTGNPTVTTAAALTAYSPPIQATTKVAVAPPQQELDIEPGWGPFILAPGEGICFRQTGAGDVDHNYNITVVWAEA